MQEFQFSILLLFCSLPAHTISLVHVKTIVCLILPHWLDDCSSSCSYGALDFVEAVDVPSVLALHEYKVTTPLCYILEAASRAKWDRFKDAVEILGVASFLHHNVTLQECLRAVFFKCLLFSSCLFSSAAAFLTLPPCYTLMKKAVCKERHKLCFADSVTFQISEILQKYPTLQCSTSKG